MIDADFAFRSGQLLPRRSFWRPAQIIVTRAVSSVATGKSVQADGGSICRHQKNSLTLNWREDSPGHPARSCDKAGITCAPCLIRWSLLIFLLDARRRADRSTSQDLALHATSVSSLRRSACRGHATAPPAAELGDHGAGCGCQYSDALAGAAVNQPAAPRFPARAA